MKSKSLIFWLRLRQDWKSRAFQLRFCWLTTTEAMSISGILEERVEQAAVPNNAGRIELHMNLNSDRYFFTFSWRKAESWLRSHRFKWNHIRVIKVTARFCGLPVQKSVAVSASDHNILVGNAQPLSHFIDADTTYRVSATRRSRWKAEMLSPQYPINCDSSKFWKFDASSEYRWRVLPSFKW